MRPAAISPTEHQEQEAVIAWARVYRIPEGFLSDFLIMIPNESLLSAIPAGPRRHAYWAKLKRLGFRRGAHDLQLALPRSPYHGLWIEMKRPSRAFGTPRAIERAVSDEQRSFGVLMRSVGYMAEVAFGQDEARNMITNYLG